ncbi:MAG TPA: hypothetical protein DEU93_00640 [Chitinophagaceae bacterium]|nr:hypothetical protein [Chitinophagaceae bacterium]
MAQVKLQSGAAEFNVPIYSYSDNQGVSTSIVLDYKNGNGLKVNEIASEVGTGWSLESGGFIEREQRGLPDDQCRASAVPNPLPLHTQMTEQQYYDTYFPNGYLFSTYSPDDVITNEGSQIRMMPNFQNWHGIEPEKEIFSADREQDIFRLRAGAVFVEFVINKNGSVQVLNNVNNLKFEIVYEDMLIDKIRTRISKFIVTTSDGIKYVFSEKELTQTCKYIKAFQVTNGYTDLDENYTPQPGDFQIGYAYCVGCTPPPQTNTYPAVFYSKRTGNFTVNKWYLSEIVNPIAVENGIKFHYEEYDFEINAGRQMEFYESSNLIINKLLKKALRISQVEVPSKDLIITFNYESYPRIDVPDVKPLKEIVIKRGIQQINKYVFQYQYFFTSIIKPYTYSFHDNEKYLLRLSLKSVQKFGKDMGAFDKPYYFEYYTGNPEYAFGGYNTNGPFRVTADIVPPMFSLWTDHWGYYNITLSSRLNPAIYDYPMNYIPEYFAIKNECQQAHIFKQPIVGMAKNGILREVVYPAGGKLLYEYEQNSAFHAGQDVYTGGVRVSKTVLKDGFGITPDLITEYKYLDESGLNSSGYGYENYTYSIERGRRVYKQSANKKAWVLFKDYAVGGAIENSVSMGILSNLSISAVNAAISTLVAQIIIAMIDLNSPEYTDYNIISYTNIPYQMHNPLPHLYSRVELMQYSSGNPPTNGKTIYEFTSITDKPFYTPILNYPFSNMPRYNRTFYGLIKRIKVIENNGNTVKENIYDYETSNSEGYKSTFWRAIKEVFDTYPTTHDTYFSQSNNISSQSYYSSIERTSLKSAMEKVYDGSNIGYLEKTINYTYNSLNHKPSIIHSIDSKGNTIETHAYYPGDMDFNLYPVYQEMINRNITDKVVCTETWQVSSGTDPLLLDCEVNKYEELPGGQILVSTTFNLQTSSPLTITSIGPFNNQMLIRNPSYIKPVSDYTYDNYNNVVEAKQVESGQIVSNIFDYKGEYIIAKVQNAKSSEIAYTSFEDNLNNSHNWITNGVSFTASEGPTGKMIAVISAGSSISTSVTINKPYKLTLWANAGLFQINNGINPKFVSNPVNGWSYYEFDIQAGEPSLVITGDCSIDEIRLYPQESIIETYTFDISGNITSRCDDNNRITYYEYDLMNRIYLKRDLDKNILEKFEYNQ